MSMISAKIDELRQMAESVGLAMPQAATLMMEAADTIWELRGSVYRERAEADTLRHQLADVTESMGRVEERCAKLRELLGGVGYLLFALDVDYCVACPRDSNAHPCPVYTVKGGECLYKTDMRELGVEVD